MIGCLFIVSGFEKLIQPYENFLYVIQSYELVSGPLAEIVARFFPWFEFIFGVFLVVGLWIKVILRGVFILTAIFIITVSQALFRNLPLKECGCFGELVSVPLVVVVLFDSCLLVTITVLKSFIERTSRFSLDHYFQNK